MVQPWNIIISPWSFASLRMSSYNPIICCLSPPKKSTLSPFTPHSCSHFISRLRSIELLMHCLAHCGASFQYPLELYHTNTPTPLLWAYLKSSSIRLRPMFFSHPPSMSVNSYPICAARSINFIWSS